MKSQKELKEEYKQKKSKSGVFQIKNTSNQKIYIESSNNLDSIWNRLKFELNFGSHRNTQLQSDWKQFGEENFIFEVLAEIKPKDGEAIDVNKQAKILESMYLEELKPFNEKGYNIQKP